MAHAADGRDRCAILRGQRFHYREWGHGAAPPLVLLHGFLAHARSWDGVARALRAQYRVLALDQRGHGESEWASDYAWQRWLEDLDAFLVTVGARPAVLVGHSMGGWIAYVYAARHPAGVERLVIVDSGPDDPSVALTSAPYHALPDVFDDPDEPFRLRRAGVPERAHAELRRWLDGSLRRRPDGRWTWRYDPALHAASIEPPAGVQWDALARIACPALLVRGAHSELLSRATAERMARVVPVCRLVEVSDAGHTVYGDNPEGFITELRPFLGLPAR
jgi:pimeloyl-ACP methyl ester carboxylesterase